MGVLINILRNQSCGSKMIPRKGLENFPRSLHVFQGVYFLIDGPEKVLESQGETVTICKRDPTPRAALLLRCASFKLRQLLPFIGKLSPQPRQLVPHLVLSHR